MNHRDTYFKNKLGRKSAGKFGNIFLIEKKFHSKINRLNLKSKKIHTDEKSRDSCHET